MKYAKSFFFHLPLLILLNCTPVTEKNEPAAPLPSWNEGKTKAAIINFVDQATDINSPSFIAAPDRIAVFDNDGTLWSEQPLYFQFAYAIDRLKAIAPEHPEWQEKQPYKAILANDFDTFATTGVHGILEIVMATHAGSTTEEFQSLVTEWLNSAQHPRFGRLYKELVYQPMLELIDYLKMNNFKVFIVSGGGLDFMRPWVEEVYGIPKDQVVGSSIVTEYATIEGKPVIKKLPEVDFIDDKEGKPLAIHKFIGRKPVFAVGNSDGDLEMLQWTNSQENSFKLYIHHTDSVREWAYDRNSHIGRFDKAQDYALQKEWPIVNMAKDWKVIYPFELAK